MRAQAKPSYISNDDVMTPIELCKTIVEYLNPSGVILEPCRGTGNFYNLFPSNSLWCELSEGKDFLQFSGKADWIITNPPYSKARKFLAKSMEVSNNVCFLITINHIWTKARLRDIREHDFGIKEIILCNTPKNFPQAGFQLGVVWLQKKYTGDIKLVKLKE